MSPPLALGWDGRSESPEATKAPAEREEGGRNELRPYNGSCDHPQMAQMTQRGWDDQPPMNADERG